MVIDGHVALGTSSPDSDFVESGGIVTGADNPWATAKFSELEHAGRPVEIAMVRLPRSMEMGDGLGLDTTRSTLSVDPG
jgi:hypothetical protein